MKQPSYREAFWFWLKLGFISFGGPAGQIAIMHEFLVDKKKWISDSRFLHALNYTMILPGPEAQQLATYTGWLLHGTRGGLTAGVLFILPSMFILLILSALYAEYGNIPWVYAMFNGLKPAVIAIVIVALIKIGRKSLHTTFHLIVALAAFTGIFFYNIPFPLLIIAAILLGFATRKYIPGLFHRSASSREEMARDEGAYFINQSHQTEKAGFKLLRLFKQIGIASVLLLIPITLFFFTSDDFQFWSELAIFFTKAAFVTFGGAYAVLPYVAQVSVEQLYWLTELQMIDGLALGETTPGPLVMVLVFVGFMASYNNFDGSLSMGSLGLLITTFYTFVPCFLFIFAGAPIIEKTRDNSRISQAMSIVTAAVVGVILNLTIYLGKAVIVKDIADHLTIDYVALGWIAISFLAMYKFKVGMIPWIAVSALFGLLYFIIF
jgi:chromate transporter